MQIRNQKKSAASPKQPASRTRRGPASRKPACCPQLGDALDPQLFKALGDPTRIHILVQLAQCCGPLTVTQVAACCNVDLSVVSRHLAVLRDAGVLTVQKEGRQMLYTVRFDELTKTLRQLADAIQACCPPAPKKK